MQTLTTLMVALSLSVPVFADWDTAGQWAPAHQHQAEVLSNIFVTVPIALDAWQTIRHDNRSIFQALGCQVGRLGFAVGVSEGLKRIVHRERPDGSDNRSWPSEHTMIDAASSAGWKWQVMIPLTALTGYGRVAAGKHHWSDIAGGAIGFLAQPAIHTIGLCR